MKRTTRHGMTLQLLEGGIVVAMWAKHVALGHPRLRLAHDEFVLAQRAASTGVSTLDDDSLRQRPRVLARRAIHSLWFNGNKLHIAATAPAAR